LSRDSAIFVSDLHANLRLPHARLSEGNTTSDRLSDVLGILDQVRTVAEKRSVAHVFILGDLFDVKHPDGPTLVGVARALGQMVKDDLNVWILPGNHDAVDRDGRLYTLQFLGELQIPGITVLHHDVYDGIIDGVTFHSLPWLPEERATKRLRNMTLQDGRNVVLFHQEVAGAIGDSGWKSPSGLDADLFERFDMALTGHYHRAQRHAAYQYLGSPIQLRFCDIEAPIGRGFWLVDFAAKKLKTELISTAYPLFGEDHLRLEHGDDVRKLVDIEESASGLAYLKLAIEGPAQAIDDNRAVLQKWKESADELGLRSLVLDLKPEKAKRLRIGKAPGESAGVSMREAVNLYVNHAVDEGRVEGGSSSEYAQLGAELLEEAERTMKGH
jgi:DNA repair exonuclease SbcCD nuclease subunit